MGHWRWVRILLPVLLLGLLLLWITSAPAAKVASTSGTGPTTPPLTAPGLPPTPGPVGTSEPTMPSPVPSPTGPSAAPPPPHGRIAFSELVGNQEDVYLIDASGANKLRLTRDGESCCPVWSPDGQRIVFASGRDGDGEIYVMNADGTNQTRLTTAPGTDQNPVWSPDGTQIAFLSQRDGRNEIYVMDADGSHQTRLTFAVYPAYGLTWSPDSQRIAFLTAPPADQARGAIFLVGTDGTPPTRLTVGGEPEWFPDGHRLLYEVGSDLLVINADGSGLTNLTPGPEGGFGAALSPDGTRIAFATGRHHREGPPGSEFTGLEDIYVMQADGSKQTRLTTGELTGRAPVWSPDGTQLLFSRSSGLTGGSGSIYVMNADGSGQRLLTTGDNAAWQPQPAPPTPQATLPLLRVK